MQGSNVRPYSPEKLVEGLPVDDVKAIPAVRELLLRLVNEEKALAFEQGKKMGFDAGYADGMIEAKSEYKAIADDEVQLFLKSASDVLDAMSVVPEKILADLSSKIESFLLKSVSSIISDFQNYSDVFLETLTSELMILKEDLANVELQFSSKIPSFLVESSSSLAVKSIQVLDIPEPCRVLVDDRSYLFDISGLLSKEHSL